MDSIRAKRKVLCLVAETGTLPVIRGAFVYSDARKREDAFCVNLGGTA